MAGVKISQLVSGGAITSQDEFPIARAGIETYKLAASQIVTDGANVGVGSGQLYFGKTTVGSTILQFRSLSGVDGLSVINQGNTLVISASGQNPVKTSITGNGTTTTFAVNGATSVNPNNYRVDIDGVLQEPINDYTIVGSNIIFNPAPPAGSKVTVVSNNLVRAFDTIPSDGSVTPQKLNLLSGNVGIGTNTPGANLQVIGSSTTQPAVIITGNTSTYWPQTSIWFNDTAVGGRSYSIGNGGATGSFAIADQTAGQARLTIDSTGRVGIGTSAPQREVETFNAAGGNAIQARSSTITTDFGITFANDSAFLFTRTNHPILFGTNNSERMRITSSGNVGIGIGNPQLNLHVNRSIAAEHASAEGPFLSLLNTQKTGSAINNWTIFNMTGAYTDGLAFWRYAADGTNLGASLWLQDNGSVAIGPTGSYGTGRLSIKQGAENYTSGGLSLIGSNSTNRWNLLAATNGHLYFGYNAADRAYILNNTGGYNTVSDSRLKKNITNCTYGLKDVEKLRPVEYNMKDESDTSKKHLGFIAQEVKEVIDNVVTNASTSSNEEMYFIDKSELVPVLVKAIQELKTELDSVKQELQALKG